MHQRELKALFASADKEIEQRKDAAGKAEPTDGRKRKPHPLKGRKRLPVSRCTAVDTKRHSAVALQIVDAEGMLSIWAMSDKATVKYGLVGVIFCRGACKDSCHRGHVIPRHDCWHASTRAEDSLSCS